jgi:hypothetical protein
MWRRPRGTTSVSCSATKHINLLEMRAVLLALQHFKTLLVSKAVVPATDNTTVVAYLQNQGGTRCHQSQKIAHLASYTIPVDCLTDHEMCEVAPSEKPFWRSPSLHEDDPTAEQLSSSSASDGQYDSGGLLTESRRNSLSCSLSSLQGNFSSIAHSSGSQTYSRDLQCTGRLSVSLDHTPDTDFPSRKAPHPWRLESVYSYRRNWVK